jgi:hypothetical protein
MGIEPRHLPWDMDGRITCGCAPNTKEWNRGRAAWASKVQQLGFLLTRLTSGPGPTCW